MDGMYTYCGCDEAQVTNQAHRYEDWTCEELLT